jgi:hypothetical protein
LAGKRKKSGRAFEEAVWAFARAINPDATVRFDHYVPDRETGTARQCDVWIETLIGGHWPLKINVSCKDYQRKLDVGHIDTFIRETEARGATMGVLYSRNGLTRPALQKAKKNDVCCCRLYDNQPADIPHVIWWDCYACQVHMRLEYSGTADSELTWNDVFEHAVDGKTFIEHIDQTFRDAERRFIDEATKVGSTAQDFCVGGSIPGCADEAQFKLFGLWQFYKDRREAHYLDGSYCETSGQFAGSIATPAVDMHSSHFGEAWEKVDRSHVPPVRMMIVKYGSHVEKSLRQQLGPRRLKEPLSLPAG